MGESMKSRHRPGRYVRYQKPYEKTEAGKKSRRKYIDKIYYPKNCAECGCEAVYDDKKQIQNGRILSKRLNRYHRRFFICNECG